MSDPANRIALTGAIYSARLSGPDPCPALCLSDRDLM